MLLAGCRSPAPTVAAGDRLWRLEPGDSGLQRLFRVQVESPSERGSLRLVLRLWSASRFELAASDPLGRALWRLQVTDGAGVWRDESRDTACRLDPAKPLRWPALGVRVRPDDLPAILLGRLPEPTAGEIGGERIGEVSHVDGEGRTWRVVFDERGLARWRLEHDGEPLVWHREDRGGRLELGSPAVEVRWKEVARETLRATAPDPADAAAGGPECVLEDLS